MQNIKVLFFQIITIFFIKISWSPNKQSTPKIFQMFAAVLFLFLIIF